MDMPITRNGKTTAVVIAAPIAKVVCPDPLRKLKY
jgi:hypothetical protein